MEPLGTLLVYSVSHQFEMTRRRRRRRRLVTTRDAPGYAGHLKKILYMFFKLLIESLVLF